MSIMSFYSVSSPSQIRFLKTNQTHIRSANRNNFRISCCSSSTNTDTPLLPTTTIIPKKRKRYRKQYPGECNGIVEEMRFVAMRLRNTKNNDGSRGEAAELKKKDEDDDDDDDDFITWQPSMEGFLKHLVDSKLVFNTLDRIVEESNHVAYAYFRKTGLERSQGLSKDLEWFSQQNILIPPPSTPGISYAEYLNELAEKCAPSFLCHFYNIYFAHIAGGQVIAKQVSEKLLDGRELEFYKWEGNIHEMIKDVREKLNKLGEHWSRDEKSRCLREAAKSFRFSGEIVRLIIL